MIRYDKFVIFGAISTLLAAAMYVSCISYLFAAEYRCVSSPDKKTTFCYLEGTDPFTVAICTKDKKGGWKCNAYDQTRVTSYIPASLKEALDQALAGDNTGGNETSGKRTLSASKLLDGSDTIANNTNKP